MVQKIVTMLVCDNPECGAEQEMASSVETTPGIHINVKVVDGEKQRTRWREVYACSLGCVCEAIGNA